MDKANSPKVREAVYFALLSAAKEGRFLEETLEKWRIDSQPTSRDYHLAQQIAYGTVQMALALDYMAKQFTDEGVLKLKSNERILLRMALYQYYYLSRVPLYAIANEMVALANKYCHQRFAGFLNAILRKAAQVKPELPTGNNFKELSIAYSYPEYFVEQIVKDYGVEKAKEILILGNIPAMTMLRIRPNAPEISIQGVQTIIEEPCKVAKITDLSLLSDFSSSPFYYIQNVTNACLIASLCRQTSHPDTILDLCASPGGKTIAVHDCFPTASLFANDISQEKLEKIAENCKKYEIDAKLSCSPAEEFSYHSQFDIIILDVPCSNSGVLNKRPEARWRITEKALNELEELQFKMITRAASLLKDNGEIWYMTCSILKTENEQMTEKACRKLSLQKQWEKCVVPSKDGWDGGYACRLKKVKL